MQTPFFSSATNDLDKLDFTDIQYTAQSTPVNIHPLIHSSLINTAVESTPQIQPIENQQPPNEASDVKENDDDFFDPLGAFETSKSNEIDVTNIKLPPKSIKEKSVEKIDVMTGKLMNTLQQDNSTDIPNLDPIINGFEPWTNMKEKILKEFTATDRLSLETVFLNREAVKHRQTSKERVTTEASIKLVGLSQADFENKMKDYRKLLLYFWSQERRLDCISLIIEVTRLLNSISVPQYYPSIFVHVTDILDLFGNLVYQRLLEKAKIERAASHLPSLPQHFVTAADILEHTRITTRNWFGKVQDIKEALPRIYVELSLLKCMKFMDDTSIMANIMRIGSLIRSIQHPLISSYARCYLCRISMRIDATDRAPHWLCINDWMQTYKVQPIRLLWPSLQYIVQCVSYGAVTYNDLLPLWEYCSVGNHRSILLCSFVNGISKFYLTEHAMEITKLVTNAEEVSPEEIICLGKNICVIQVEERYRKQILRLVWKCINKIIAIPGFLASINIWIEFVAKYFSSRELGIILDQVLRHININKIYEHHYTVLTSIIDKIMLNSLNLIDIFELDVFVRFIDLFRKDTIKREISSIILTSFVKRTRRGALNNLKLAYFIIDICKKLHDSVSIYSTDDEVNTVAILIQNSLDKFLLDSDPERSLEFLVSCRAATMNVDKIQKYIIQRMLSLTLDITRRSKFSTAQTAFLQSCIANLFISIPSLLDPVDRIKLYIQSGHVAIAAQAFLFIDVFLQAAVKDFISLTNPNDFCEISPFFLSLLVTKPDPFNDEKRTAFLKLIKKYLQAIEKFTWPSTQIATNQKGKCLLSALQTQLFRRRLYDKSTVAAIQSEQFKWIDKSSPEQNIETIDEGILITVTLLQPILENEKSELLPLNLELVEIIGKFGGDDEIVEDLAEMAKLSYKKCKKYPQLKNRLLAVKKDKN